ncbi:MAG: hypothetical protein V3S00_05465, partial [Dehalococcoidia bacterium]
MVQGRTPEDIGDEDIQELIQIAMIRLDAGRQVAESCGEAKRAVLDRLLARLNLLNVQVPGVPNGATSVNDLTGESASDYADPEHVDVKELQDVIDLRRQMAEHAAAISES